jgi:uridine kinase
LCSQNNSVATDLIVTHIRRQLSERSIKFRSKLSSSFPNPTNPPDLLSTSASSSSSPLAANDNLILLPSTPGLRALLTTLHSQATGREEFISSCDRLSTLIVERALALLPYEERRVVTPLGEEVVGVDSRVEKEDVVGVSVARS